MLRRSFLGSLISLPATGILFPSSAAAQGGIQVTSLGGKLHLLSGAGGNIAILEGADGLLLIDSGLADATAGILGETKKFGKPQITRLINTHWHFDHTGSNVAMGESGAKILSHVNTRARLATKQTVEALGRTFEPLAAAGLPVETFKDAGKLSHGGESVAYTYLPPAHTDGDTVIHFENAGVLHTGDLMFNGGYPFIDYSSGGSLPGMVANAERLWKLVDAKTRVIPGHGPVATKADVKVFHDVIADCLEVLSKLIHAGKTLEQVQAAKPFAKYDDTWGKGFLKPEQWLALNYTGMMKMGHKPAA